MRWLLLPWLLLGCTEPGRYLLADTGRDVQDLAGEVPLDARTDTGNDGGTDVQPDTRILPVDVPPDRPSCLGTICHAECVTTSSDPRYCGNCTTTCAAEQSCTTGSCQPRSVDPMWGIRRGTRANESISSVVLDARGNIFVLGIFDIPVPFEELNLGGGALRPAIGGGGMRDLFVAGFSDLGDHRWSYAIGSSGTDDAGDLVLLGDHLYFTGGFHGTSTLDGRASSAALVVGRIPLAGERPEVSIIPGNGIGQGLAADASGRLWITGYYDGPLTFPPSATLTSAVDRDGFVAFAPVDSWPLHWQQAWALAGTGPDGGSDIALHAGTAYVTGSTTNCVSTTSSVDVRLTRCAPGMPVCQTSCVGGPGLDWGQSMAVRPDGSIWVLGGTEGNFLFGSSSVPVALPPGYPLMPAPTTTSVVLVYRADGNPSAALILNRTDPGSLVADGAGPVYVTGNFAGSFLFGTTLLSAVGARDLFVASLDAALAPRWVRGYGTSGDDDGMRVAIAPGHIVSAAAFGMGPVMAPIPRIGTGTGGLDVTFIRL